MRFSTQLPAGAVLALVLVACTQKGVVEEGSPATVPSGMMVSAVPADAGGMPGMGGMGSEPSQIPAVAQRIKVTATEFEFDKPDLDVKAGVPVALTFENQGSADHDWTLHDESGQAVDGAHAHASPGGSWVAVFTLAKGKYQVWCTVPGHKEAGMVGTVTAT